MNIVLILITLLCVILTSAAVGYLVYQSLREKKRFQDEAKSAEAARKYLEKFGINCRIFATRTAQGIVLLVETEPHKKLRFSYIIEQPMRKFVSETAGVWVQSIFWRFRVNPKQLTVPEVQYGEPASKGGSVTGSNVEPGAEMPSVPEVKPEMDAHEAIESDDYFQTSRQILLEEASWDDFTDLLQTEQPSEKPDQKNKS
jgi:hypothetical protein